MAPVCLKWSGPVGQHSLSGLSESHPTRVDLQPQQIDKVHRLRDVVSPLQPFKQKNNSSVSISDMSRPARTLSCDTLGPRPLTFAQDRPQSVEHGGPEVAVHGLDYFLFRTLTLSHFPVIMFFSSSVKTAAARILGLASHLDRSRPQHWEPNGSHPNPDGQTTSTWNGNFSQDGHHHHPYHHARWDPNGISWPQHEGHGPSSRGGMHELKSFHLFHVDRLLLR